MGLGRVIITPSTLVSENVTGPASPDTFQIDVQVFDDYEAEVSVPWLKMVVAHTLAEEEVQSSSAVDVIVADDETVRELNARHRGLEETTDVLAFPHVGGGEYHGIDDRSERDRAELEGAGEFVLPPGQKAGLGEIVVSYSQARRQAAERGHSTEREMAALLIHGVLHLLGYDHMEAGDRSEMESIEARVLSGVSE